MNTPSAAHPKNAPEAPRLLAIYLRDHAAGAAAGEALARRCRRANVDTPFAELLADIEAEIADDRRTLHALMEDLGIAPSHLKAALGSIAELVGRMKTNGRLVRYSPSSRVVELEGLAAGVLTKRNLWRSLRGITDRRTELDPGQLDGLEQRATDQLDRLLEAHGRASAMAFVGAE